MHRSQKERVLAYIKEHGGITQLEAIFDLGISRLSARIFDLKKDGYFFDTKVINVQNRFGETVKVVRYEIPFNRAISPVYANGTMSAWCFNPVTGDLDYYSNKEQTNQHTT